MTRSRLAARLARRVTRDPVLRAVARSARETGTRVFLVGGTVRDAALGRPEGDVDLSAGPGAGAFVSGLRRLWGTRGFRVSKRGVTTWRFVIDERPVDIVDASRRGLAADLARRELTINAIAYDLAEGAIVDPLGGLRDLRSRRLRSCGSRVMRDDPVRALRAARFLAELPDFRLHRDLRRQARDASARIGRTSVERIAAELDRTLVANAPDRGLREIESLGLLPHVLPELSPMIDCVAGRDRPSVFEHTLLALARSTATRGYAGGRIEGDGLRVLRWSLLLHDISKPETLSRADDGRPTFHGHETIGARRAEGLLRRLRFPRAHVRRVGRLVLLHLRPHHIADSGITPRAVSRLVRDAGDDLPLLVRHAACDALASGAPDPDARWRRLRSVLRCLLERYDRSRQKPLPRLVTGRDVMRVLSLPPGPEVGERLDEIRELQEAGIVRTRKDALSRLESQKTV